MKATQEAKHTPGPWRLSTFTRMDYGKRIKSWGILAEKDGFPVRIATEILGSDWGEEETNDKANAEFIVRACNAHADLLAVAKDAQLFLDGLAAESAAWPLESRKRLSGLGNSVAAAIRKAEGGAA